MEATNNPDSGIGLYDGVDQIANMEGLMNPEMDKAEDQSEAVTEEVSVTDEELVYEASEESVETDEQEQQLEVEEEEPELYTVRVKGGREVKVTLEELTNSWSRESDYRHKTQEVAEQRKTVERQIQEAQAQFQKTQQMEQQYAELLPKLAQQLQADNQPEPDWNAAYEADPIEATKLERQYRVQKEDRAKKLQAIQSEQQRLMQESQQGQQARYQQHLAEQAQLLPELIPSWADETVKATEVEAMRKWAVDSGRVSPDQINQISDAGHVALLHDAWKFGIGQAKVQSKRKTATSKKGKAVRPGSKAATPNAQSTAVKNAAGTFKQTPTVRNASEYIAELNLD